MRRAASGRGGYPPYRRGTATATMRRAVRARGTRSVAGSARPGVYERYRFCGFPPFPRRRAAARRPPLPAEPVGDDDNNDNYPPPSRRTQPPAPVAPAAATVVRCCNYAAAAAAAVPSDESAAVRGIRSTFRSLTYRTEPAS
ncbi:Hypothetical protein CINCED_3A015299 [Cinara cedri]|uniref:Uncharacterized protein n=1 Tax=Cinara cedri TaxID=506608 RepID=A0A5E4N932_9HEMI|nr:Hypothetical protein CINCED_3A015299 [Cinara cedri]